MPEFDREQGYIKLHRQVLSSAIWPNLNDWRLAETILLRANWKPGTFQSRNGDVLEIGRGQLVTSLESLSRDSGLSIRNVRTALEHLEKVDFLTSRSTNHFRLISVVNYEKYQKIDKHPDKDLTSTRQRYKKGKKEKNTPTADSQASDLNSNAVTTPNTPPNSAPPPVPDGFSEFWQAYPRKTAKQAALKAWAKLAPAPDIQTHILTALEAQKRGQDWIMDGGKYIPYPASWLNGARWEDEIATTGGKQHEHAASLYC